MGKLTVGEFVSLDGVFEAPGGEPGYRHTGWVTWYPDEKQLEYNFEEVKSHEALLLGRITYESFAGAWPHYEEALGEFAVKMNTMPKFIASTTLKDPEWNNSSVLQGNTVDAVRKMKQDIRGDILVAGSGTLVQTLKQHDLVDEYHLMVFPVILGSGRRLFDESEDATRLELLEMRRLDSGAVIVHYRPTRAAVTAQS
jgi:dihydrofolate reductase